MIREHDRFVRFHFPELSIRGAWVHLDDSFNALCTGRSYPLAVEQMLGELACITTLMAGQLKHAGRLTFQMRASGPINLLVMDCTDSLGIRGTAQWREEFIKELINPASQCLNRAETGEESRLVMTLDAHKFSTPWQSHVPLIGQNLSEAFAHYLTQSEQQSTLLKLTACKHSASGLFLQKMPGADELDEDGWNRITHLFNTLTNKELLELEPSVLLTRIFPEELINLAPGQIIHHAGERNWGKIHNMLRNLGRIEVEEILNEQGEIIIHDDLSNIEYRLNKEDVAALFKTSDEEISPPSQTLH